MEGTRGAGVSQMHVDIILSMFILVYLCYVTHSYITLNRHFIWGQYTSAFSRGRDALLE